VTDRLAMKSNAVLPPTGWRCIVIWTVAAGEPATSWTYAAMEYVAPVNSLPASSTLGPIQVADRALLRRLWVPPCAAAVVTATAESPRANQPWAVPSSKSYVATTTGSAARAGVPAAAMERSTAKTVDPTSVERVRVRMAARSFRKFSTLRSVRRPARYGFAVVASRVAVTPGPWGATSRDQRCKNHAR
jgi:hypothetical protein